MKTFLTFIIVSALLMWVSAITERVAKKNPDTPLYKKFSEFLWAIDGSFILSTPIVLVLWIWGIVS